MAAFARNDVQIQSRIASTTSDGAATFLRSSEISGGGTISLAGRGQGARIELTKIILEVIVVRLRDVPLQPASSAVDEKMLTQRGILLHHISIVHSM